MSSDFRQRWGLPEESSEKRFEKTIYRILAFLGEEIETSEDKLRHLAYIAGTPVYTYQSNRYYGVSYFDAAKYFHEARQPVELAQRIEDLLKSDILTSDEKEGVSVIVNREPLDIRVGKNKKGDYITYPQGETMLDEKVIERTLLCLDGKSAGEYAKALKAYASGKWNDASNNTRRALEEYLRQYLDNQTGLSANIKKLGALLKDGVIADHFRNSIINQITTLDKHYNEGSKHGSITQGAVEAEYLIYSVGIIINTLAQIKTLETAPSD